MSEVNRELRVGKVSGEAENLKLVDVSSGQQLSDLGQEV